MAGATRARKIVCVASFMNNAGAQEAIVRVAGQLRVRGHDARVLFLYKEKEAFTGKSFVDVISDKGDLTLLNYLSVFATLLKVLKQEKPDAVICFMPLGTVMGCLAAFLSGIPIRIASQRAPGPTFGTFMRLLDRLWGSTSIYTRIVCVSEAVRQSFRGYAQTYWNKLLVVHNGICWEPSALSKAEARRRFALPENKLLFMAAGRMKHQKNYPFLMDRVRDVPGMNLVIAGDGDDRPELEAMIARHGIEDRVICLGAIKHSDVVDLYTACDVFVQTSLFEGQSNATLEAMHAGLPIIVSDISMQRETLCRDDGECVGLLVSLDEPEAWNRRLTELIESPQLRRSLGAAASRYVEERFTLKAMIDGFEQLVVQRSER